MRVLSALIAVVVLGVIAWVGAGAGMQWIFGAVVPYAAFAIFVVFFINRIRKWANAPVPYRIPTTCGQAKSLDWIKHDSLEAPHDTIGVLKRMFLEVVLFRSLFRNTKTDHVDDGDGGETNLA